MAGEIRILIKSITESGDEYENVQEFIYVYDMAAEANLWGNETRKRIFPALSQLVCTTLVRWFLTDNQGAGNEAVKREIKE